MAHVRRADQAGVADAALRPQRRAGQTLGVEPVAAAVRTAAAYCPTAVSFGICLPLAVSAEGAQNHGRQTVRALPALLLLLLQ